MRENSEVSSSVRGETTSNLVRDPELTERFQTTALKIATSLKFKYYQVFEEMDPDDIVSECWKKILMEDISYDPDRGASFSTFVRMLVECRILDFTRSINKSTRVPNPVYLNQEVVGYENSSSQEVVYQDLVPDRDADEEFNIAELMVEMKEYSDLFNSMPEFEKTIRMCVQGYSVKEISDTLNIHIWDVGAFKKVLRNVRNNRIDGSAKPLAEIMYYESQDWELEKKENETREQTLKRREDQRRYNYLIDFAWMVKDNETGISLIDLVRPVVSGLSYSKISEKLKGKYPDVNEYTVKRVLKKYEGVMI